MIRADTMWSGSPTETALVKDTMSLKFPVVHVNACQCQCHLASVHVNVNDLRQMIRADTRWSGSPTETALVKDTMSLKFPVVHVIDIQNPIDNAVALKA